MILLQLPNRSNPSLCLQFLPEVEAVLVTLINEGKFMDWPLDLEEESIVESAFLACLNTGEKFAEFLQNAFAKLDFDENLVDDIISFTTDPWYVICNDTRNMLHRILVNRSTVVISASTL